MKANISDVSNAVLGETNEVIELERSETVRETALDLVRQARHTVDIIARHLDPAIYDNEAFAEALKQLAISSPRAKIRILVLDPGPLLSQGHRLIELGSRLSSFITLRKPAPEHKDFNEAMLIVDQTGYIHRRFSDRFEGIANFNDRRHAVALATRFDELWSRAVPDANFRRLHL